MKKLVIDQKFKVDKPTYIECQGQKDIILKKGEILALVKDSK